MNARSNTIVGYALSLVVAVLFSTMTFAYVLQGPHILQLMTEKLGQADSLFISQKVVFYNLRSQPESPIENNPAVADILTASRTNDPQGRSNKRVDVPIRSQSVQLDESLRYVFSEAFRSDITSDNNQRIYVFRKGQTLTVIDGVISGAGETRFDLYKDLLLYRSRETLSERLSYLGIDIFVSSLGKYDGKIALVIGAEFPDETVPQVWVDKETFQPLRMIIPGTKSPYSNSPGLLEIRYSQWQEIGKIRYPMQIEFIQDGKTVRAIEVDDYQINPHFSNDMFDIARLKLEYRQPGVTPDRSAEKEGLSEVQKTIEEFKKIFE
jgi:hypothetical protein